MYLAASKGVMETTWKGDFQLRDYELFSKLNDDEMLQIENAHTEIRVRKGDFIYFESQYLNKIYFIKEGYVKTGYIDSRGSDIIKEILHPGEIFGQFGMEQLHMNGEFAQVYKTNACVCVFNIDIFRKIMKQNNKLALAFSEKVSKKLRRMESRFVNMLHADVKTRLMRFFYDLLQSGKNPLPGNSVILDNYLTHCDVARMIGSTRQTVTSIFNEPEFRRLVHFSKKQIIIPDINAVRKMSVL